MIFLLDRFDFQQSHGSFLKFLLKFEKFGSENVKSRYYSVITVRGVASEIMTLDFWWSKLYLLQPQARKIKLRGGHHLQIIQIPLTVPFLSNFTIW